MKPVLQALLLAEHVYEDKRTGSKIICGTLNRLMRSSKPHIESSTDSDGKEVKNARGGGVGCVHVYIGLTDVVDGTKISLQLVDTQDNEVLMCQNIVFEKANRLDLAEVVAVLPPVSLFAAGRNNLSMDVVWNDEILGAHRLTVVDEAPSPQGEE